VEETRHVVPDDVDHVTRCGVWGDSNGCRDGIKCGPVLPSARFPGGLTHRSAPCTDYRAAYGPPAAVTENWFPVPDTVRGIEAMRIAFAGAPTVDGEADAGTLKAYSMRHRAEVTTTSSTSGSTGWIEEPWGGTGRARDHNGMPGMPPSALWSFQTTGDDSFDVASYTVDLRYLVPQR
jgi:hypothetical protein